MLLVCMLDRSCGTFDGVNTPQHQPRVVVMGVSGSGKTTVGTALAERLDILFSDADDLHPLSNISKMAAGEALTDDDRMPWLALVGAELAAAGEPGLVVACSALKRRYRDAILAAAPGVTFVYLQQSAPLLRSRVAQRKGHFMPPALLASQLATLEPLSLDEPGMTIDVRAEQGIDDVVDAIIFGLQERSQR